MVFSEETETIIFSLIPYEEYSAIAKQITSSSEAEIVQAMRSAYADGYKKATEQILTYIKNYPGNQKDDDK